MTVASPTSHADDASALPSRARLEGSVQETSSRDGAVDFMRAVAIVLIVFGHAQRGLFASGDHGSPEWFKFYVFSDYFIYTFHVPVFFITSGFLVERRSPVPRADSTTRLIKLLRLYLIWNTLNAIPAIIFSDMINRDVREGGLWALLNPLRPTGIMWFFLAFMAAHLVHALTQPFKSIRYPLMGTALLVLALGVDYSGIAYGTFWFLAGAALAHRNFETSDTLRQAAIAIGCLFGFLVVTWLSFRWEVPTTLALPSCIMAVYALYQMGRALPTSALVDILSRETLAIYVMHVIFMAGFRILLVKLLQVSSVTILITLITLAGIACPLAAAWLARRLPFGRFLLAN
jgi:fucose 4-O-acetylase-like acetyltransferase